MSKLVQIYQRLDAKVRQGTKGSTQARVEFKNGYGASVISDGYGKEQGLYEIAVMYGGSITYDTDITDDVLGHLSEEDVIEVLLKIQQLPSN